MPASRTRSSERLEISVLEPAPFRTGRQRSEALALIERLVARARVGFAGLAPRAAQLKSLAGGRSAALVFRLTLQFDREGKVQGPPLVVKIAPRAEGAREKANYDRYVRWALPVACRPELIASARTGDLCGLCYADLRGAGESVVDTLTDHLQRADTAILEAVMRGLFDPLRASWASPPLVRAETDVARRYRQRYFPEPDWIDDTEARMRDCAMRYFGAQTRDGGLAIGADLFPSPRAVLFESGRRRAYRSCIIHGDMNSDNVFISGDGANAALIDFQKTGRGHVFEDIASVEESIRINYPASELFDAIYQTERLIAQGRSPYDDPYAAAIRRIRAAALGYFGDVESAANYDFAIAALGLRLMRAVDLSDAARARITASALWSAKALAEATPV